MRLVVWITVAAIANITVFLVSIGWNGFGIADFVWTSIILLVGILIGILRINLAIQNIGYGTLRETSSNKLKPTLGQYLILPT